MIRTAKQGNFLKLLIIYYKRSLFFLSPRGGRVLCLPPSFLATRCFSAQRLRASALPSLSVWKKKDFFCSIFIINIIVYNTVHGISSLSFRARLYSGAVLKTQFLVCVLYSVHDTQSVFFSVPVLYPVLPRLLPQSAFGSQVKSSQVNFYLNSQRIIINTNLCFTMV